MRNFIKILVVVGIVGLIVGCCDDNHRAQTNDRIARCETGGGIPRTSTDGYNYLGCDFPPTK